MPRTSSLARAASDTRSEQIEPAACRAAFAAARARSIEASSAEETVRVFRRIVVSRSTLASSSSAARAKDSSGTLLGSGTPHATRSLATASHGRKVSSSCTSPWSCWCRRSIDIRSDPKLLYLRAVCTRLDEREELGIELLHPGITQLEKRLVRQ